MRSSEGKMRAARWNGFGRKRSIGDRYLAWLMWVLLGYALLGRGFAYLGVAPVYIGEATLALGLAIWSLNRFAFEPFRLLPTWLLAGFMFWNATRTLPYLSEYGVDALRDAASWGYGLFAITVATLLIARPERLGFLLDRFGRFIVIFAALAPVVWLSQLLYIELLPLVPGSSVPIVNPKAGDILVHLAGSAAFLVTGLGGPSLFVAIMLCINFPLAAFWNRGGMVAFLLALSLVVLLSPFRIRVLSLMTVFALALVLLFVTDARVQFPDTDLEVSAEQLVLNVQSTIAEDSGNTARLEGTKQWRLQWWNKIIDYTFGGDYFWTGKGYGVNLAEQDEFQNVLTEDPTPLRNPHSAHLTFLARSGVPGLVLWLSVQGTWALSMLIGHLRSRARGEKRWAGMFLFLLAYWTAFMVNASFDVYLEGPMGGIWFWTIYGVGLGTLWIYQRYPEVLGDS